MGESVSVVIPCYNEEDYIEHVIKDMVQQDYPKDLLEVIFVDGKSVDSTQELIREYADKFPFINILVNEARFKPHGMNLAIDRAKGEILICVDAHASYPSNYVSSLVKNFTSLDADNVGGVLITETKEKSNKANAISYILSHPVGVGNSFFRIGANKPMEVDTVFGGCFRVKLLKKLNGYNLRLLRNQDIELNKRITKRGGKIYLIPEITCTYFAKGTYQGVGASSFQNGLWNILTVYITKDFTSLGLRHFIPLLFLLSIIVPVLLSLYNFAFLLLSCISLAAYLAVIVWYSIAITDKTTRFFNVMWGFIVIHFSYGAGSFSGLFHINELFKRNDNGGAS